MKCAFCRDEKEEKDLIPLEDSETIQEILICNDCDYLLGIVGIGYNRNEIEKENQAEELNPKIVIKN